MIKKIMLVFVLLAASACFGRDRCGGGGISSLVTDINTTHIDVNTIAFLAGATNKILPPQKKATVTRVFTVGCVGDVKSDMSFSTAANTTAQSLNLTDIPANAQILSVSIQCIEAVAGLTDVNLSAGCTENGVEYIADANCFTLNEIISSTAMPSVSSAKQSLYVTGTPTTNWSNMTAGQWKVTITYIDPINPTSLIYENTFGTLANWTVFQCTKAADVDNYMIYGGSSPPQGMKLTATAGAYLLTYHTQSPALDVSTAKRLRCYYYIHEGSGNSSWENINYINLNLRDGASKEYGYRIYLHKDGSDRVVGRSGWNYWEGYLEGHNATAVVDANLAAIASVRFQIYKYNNDSNTPEVTLSYVGIDDFEHQVPMVMIRFDDAYTQHKQAASYLKSKGLRASFGAIKDYVGTAGFCSLSDLKEMKEMGHLIVNHCVSADPFSTDWTDSQVINNYMQMAEWMAANGLSEGNKIMIIPSDIWPPNAETLLSPYLNMIWLSSDNGRYTHSSLLGNAYMLSGCNAEGSEEALRRFGLRTRGTNLGTIYNCIREAIRTKTCFIPYWHQIKYQITFSSLDSAPNAAAILVQANTGQLFSVTSSDTGNNTITGLMVGDLVFNNTDTWSKQSGVGTLTPSSATPTGTVLDPVTFTGPIDEIAEAVNMGRLKLITPLDLLSGNY